ncbi:MAG: hypothetical protein WDM92_05125 [Caulobacteraceae bacterium]
MKGAFDPRAKLGMGVAQFGLDYPVSGPRGRSPEVEAGDILQIAARGGVACWTWWLARRGPTASWAS